MTQDLRLEKPWELPLAALAGISWSKIKLATALPGEDHAERRTKQSTCSVLTWIAAPGYFSQSGVLVITFGERGENCGSGGCECQQTSVGREVLHFTIPICAGHQSKTAHTQRMSEGMIGKWNRGFVAVLMVLAALVAGGCGEEDTGSSGGAANVNYNWPADIIGYEIQFTVVDPGDTGMDVGNVVRYTFDANGTVMGYNPKQDQWYTPESYSYTRSGHTANVFLSYFGGSASEDYTLTATSADGLKGNYDYLADVGTGYRNGSGTYEVLTTNASLGSSGGGDDQTTSTGMGKLTIYNLNGRAYAPISVYVDGSFVASFTKYHVDSGPTNCDVPDNEATVTVTREPGFYKVTAKDAQSTSWGPDTLEISEGGCTLLGLY